ncbi:LysR family transcriptional regulator [Enterocloster aldensis]|uniref:LysR family transcriptional regulator n=1 Tax=Enterocloster aldenensis TaxID=358742 RepID=A0ABX2HH80_9FIRM|nr:LysR family transcriptional regulator [Enterocloster aldenensis]
MTFEQLQCFIASVEEKTFLDAAHSLYISQSSLSKQIMKLEQELGVMLWDRSRRKAGLTEAGNIFYQDALILLKQYSQARNRLDRFRTESQLTLSVGTLPILTQYQLTPGFRDFQAAHPGIRLSLHEVEEPELMEGFEKGIYDLVIGQEAMFYGANCQTQLIAGDQLAAVLDSSHPLAFRSSLCLEELKDEDFIFMNPYTSIYNLCVIRCREAGFSPRILRTARVESILSAVLIGEGISLLAGNSVRIFKPEHIAVIPLTPKIPLPVVLARHKERPVTRAMELFWNTAFAGMA